MTKLTLPCPAKLNLFLHILGKRDDGYHNLQTVFQLLDYGDTLTMSTRQDSAITLTPDLTGLHTEDNLVYRAARLMQKHKNISLGANLHLTKNLPMGGGIGGGSSDAATAMVGLNRLWGAPYSKKELAQLGATLGADIPVFIEGKSAWAEGKGDILTPLSLPNPYFVVINPLCHVSTAKVFSHKELTRQTPPIKVAAFLDRGGKNDCQPLVERLYPQVRDAVDWLNQYGPAQLTGTGACIFASFLSENIAQDVFAKRPKHLGGFVAKGVNTSPLYEALVTED